ncbi:MAG: hypothetical protein BWK75_02005 [Candidatus Altiarchaeales archaeon A3]|nr:MAG: hypothetical protein BWK75_02005 [Candidatus Altiarchaeales archaeon A3]
MAEQNTYYFPKKLVFLEMGIIEGIYSFFFCKKVFKCPQCNSERKWKTKICKECGSKFAYF